MLGREVENIRILIVCIRLQSMSLHEQFNNLVI